MGRELFVISCGIFNISFGILHLFFWKLFDWKHDLQKISYYNRATVQILNLRMIYVFISVGFIMVLFRADIMYSALGNAILVGVLLFWLGRLIEQLIFLREKSLKVIALTAVIIIGLALHILALTLS
ncbi:MAG: hypothetical protein NTY74_16740 [Ignavibacteriae bacterium]|nr:hypothetical protein [Ignavibacteriota bacterium]